MSFLLYQSTFWARSLRRQYVVPLIVQTSSEPLAKPLSVAAGTKPLLTGARSPVPSSEPQEAELLSVVNTTSGQPEAARSNSWVLVLNELEPLAFPSYETILI